MVDFFKHKIHFVPTVGVTPRSSIVIVARNSNVAVTGGLGRGEDGEKDRESPPVREKMAVKIMCPRVFAERVVPMKFQGKAELITRTR